MAKSKSSTELKEGDRAPAFSLDAVGAGGEPETISLKALAGKTVVLYFYPKDMTPGCTQEACDFNDSSARLKKIGAVVLGISRDSVASHLKFREKHGLEFPLLSDEDGKACAAYGVWQEKSLYGRKFMGIVRTTFVIGPDQRIRKIYSKVKVNGHVADVVASLR